jgi:transposase
MDVLYPRCAGLDVHAGTVVACVPIAADGAVTYAHRTVTTTSQGLLALADWLAARLYARGHGSDRRLLEARLHVLDTGVTLVLANAMHIATCRVARVT